MNAQQPSRLVDDSATGHQPDSRRSGLAGRFRGSGFRMASKIAAAGRPEAADGLGRLVALEHLDPHSILGAHVEATARGGAGVSA